MKTIICADALDWMPRCGLRGSVVTSLPDADEVGLPVTDWSSWFLVAANAAMNLAADDAVAVFYQTDRKKDGRIISKADLLFRCASDAGLGLLWHKIVLRRSVGACDLHRPTYSHLIAFSRAGRPGHASPDVMTAGAILYQNAMGLDAAKFAVAFAGGSGSVIIDPFCGRGTVPAVAEAMGIPSIGVDISADQCRAAESIHITGDLL